MATADATPILVLKGFLTNHSRHRQQPEESSITNSQLVLFYLMVFKIAYALKIVLPRRCYDNIVPAWCQEISFF